MNQIAFTKVMDKICVIIEKLQLNNQNYKYNTQIT